MALNQSFKSQIDLILTLVREELKIKDCYTQKFYFHSDHRLLVCKMKVKNKPKKVYRGNEYNNRMKVIWTGII